MDQIDQINLKAGKYDLCMSTEYHLGSSFVEIVELDFL